MLKRIVSIAFGAFASALCCTTHGIAAGANGPANACPPFLRTNPDVLRTVSGYAQGSARNPNMTADETVKFVASTITGEVRRTAGPEMVRNSSLYYQNLERIDRTIISSCWPDLNAVLVGKEKREAVEAETQRRQREAKLQREREADAASTERTRKQSTIDAQPSNRLLKAYRSYIAIKQCFDARKGYAVVYLSEEQLQDSKVRVVAIEKAIIGADPTINSDTIWSAANQSESETPTNEIAAVFQLADAIGRQWVSSPDWIEESDGYCKRAYSALVDQYSSMVPNANVVKKDF